MSCGQEWSSSPCWHESLARKLPELKWKKVIRQYLQNIKHFGIFMFLITAPSVACIGWRGTCVAAVNPHLKHNVVLILELEIPVGISQEISFYLIYCLSILRSQISEGINCLFVIYFICVRFCITIMDTLLWNADSDFVNQAMYYWIIWFRLINGWHLYQQKRAHVMSFHRCKEA